MHRSLLTTLVFLVAFMASILPAFAQSEDVLRTRKIVNGWEKWVEKHGATQAAIAVSYKGRIMARLGLDRDATQPVPVASLSKAVTGICISKLVETGKLKFDDTLNAIVPELDSDVTIADLLRHTSGYTNDITQRPDRYAGRDKEYLEWVSEKEISKGRHQDQIGTFYYNNANYAMLGAVISKITGASYESACKELVFTPIEVNNVKLNPEWRIMSSWGGWMISAVDHVKFVNAYFGSDSKVGTAPKEYPYYQFEGALRYGMGYMFRDGRSGGTNFWHDGKWHLDLEGEKHRFAAFFVRFDNGWTISVNHNISAINNEHFELDKLFAEATHLPL